MNKIEIICYILSAYFFGIATGSFIAVGVHNHIYKERKKTEKHKPPRLCYIRRALVGASPSAIITLCTLGLRGRCRRCAGCEANVREMWWGVFKTGLKNPERCEAAKEAKKEDDQ